MTMPEGGRPSTVAAMVRARADDDNVGLVFGEQSWTWREVVAEAAMRAAWLRATLDPARPPHVGVLLPTVPEYVFQILGAALAGACIVGVNATRRGAELARDIEHTACQFVISDAAYGDLVDDSVRVEDAPWSEFNGAPLPDTDPPPSTLLFLLLTSGSTSAPKAAKCSQARLAAVAAELGFGPKAVLYCPLTLAHGNALNSTLFPALANGCRLVLRDRFSATAWLDDVRRHGVTFTTTVGRALGYILATPPTPHDRDHRLRAVLAPEASPRDTAEFRERFGVAVLSGYGSSEGGIALTPAPAKPGSLGNAPAGADIAVVNESGVECETAQFDSDGKMTNAAAAIGELVRRDAAGGFEGYWNNPDAESDRLRGGWFWSGDLAYRDADGVFWFAGRVGGLASGGLGELRGQPGGTNPRPLRRRGGGRRRRGAGSACRRPDSGHRRAAAGPVLRPGRLRRIPGRPVRPRYQVGAPVRPHHARDPGDQPGQDRQEAAAARGLAVRRTRSGGDRPDRPPTCR